MATDQVPILTVECEVEQDEFHRVEQRRFRLRAGAALAGTALVIVVGALAKDGGSHLQQQASPRDAADFFLIEKKTKEKKPVVERNCTVIHGVQVAEPRAKSAWPQCAAKWSEDCSTSGCCRDGNMKCYRKNSKWAACTEKCVPVDAQNQSWTCEEVWPATPHTSEACTAECQNQAECKQAVYNNEQGGSCHLSHTRQTKVDWAGDNVDSSFCEALGEQGVIKEFADTVKKQLPFQVEYPLVNCSWGGEDCSQTHCCNDYACDGDFTQCWGYSCYQKDKYFAGCAKEPLDGWNGTWLGGPREHRTLPAAGSTAAVQGPSLYCFTVVTWDAPRPKPFWNSEAELANNWKKAGLHVMQCDGHDILDGVITPVAEWGSFSNIDMFMDIWQKVKGIGAWQNYDWTVKVDSDAVFLPSRLKDHLNQLRTPRGARVYLENINFKFKFMGAIEIMTREALAYFLEMGHTCIRGKHDGGEDSFLKTCLDGLGIDHQSDWMILRDRYAALNGPCTDGWAVAYHYMKKAQSWSICYNEVVCGVGKPKAGECPGSIPVPHEPGFIKKKPDGTIIGKA